MKPRFSVEPQSNTFFSLQDSQIVFHGINKSGSWAMAKVIGEGLDYAGRSSDYLCHYGSKWTLDEYRALVDRAPPGTFAVAHQLYGTLKPTPGRVWVTQLRHPLPRALSVYHWLRKKHIRSHDTEDGFPSFERFVRKGRGISHSQIKQFGCGSGPFSAGRSKRLSARDLYELSVDALEREFYAIGIAELFEESIFLFATLCGLKSVAPWQTDKRNKSRPLVDEVSASDLELIREMYEWDFMLYEYALERFKKQLQLISFGSSLVQYKATCEDQYKERIEGE